MRMKHWQLRCQQSLEANCDEGGQAFLKPLQGRQVLEGAGARLLYGKPHATHCCQKAKQTAAGGQPEESSRAPVVPVRNDQDLSLDMYLAVKGQIGSLDVGPGFVIAQRLQA